MKLKRLFGNKWTIIIVLVLILVLVAVALYLNFSRVECSDYGCFSQKMSKCSKSSFLNNAPEATWRYNIKGISDNKCEITVKLMQAKEGTLGIDKLTGLEMSCFYALGEATYPEKDLDKCHGRLKEELQGIVIKKLHSYLIENLGKVDEALNSAV